MIPYARTLRFFFAAGISSVVLVTGVSAQEARYLRCESAGLLTDAVEIREEHGERILGLWLEYADGCERVTGAVEYDSAWSVGEGVVCLSAPIVYPSGRPVFEGQRCVLEDEWIAAGGER